MKIAVIRVKGGFKMKKAFKDTLVMLRLNKKHHLVMLDDTPINMGMIIKVQNLVTWGPINEETFKSLVNKRGRLAGNKRIELKDKELSLLAKDFLAGKKDLGEINKVFRLSPPKKGWDHGTTKLRYPRGALGPRGESINELIKKML